jgi:hypothetical protein
MNEDLVQHTIQEARGLLLPQKAHYFTANTPMFVGASAKKKLFSKSLALDAVKNGLFISDKFNPEPLLVC